MHSFECISWFQSRQPLEIHTISTCVFLGIMTLSHVSLAHFMGKKRSKFNRNINSLFCQRLEQPVVVPVSANENKKTNSSKRGNIR